MERKPITFYKLISPYSEDITKNCGLVGQEIDTNFLNLKNMDINNAYREGYNIVLERNDGNKINVDLSPLISGATMDFSVAYDADNGTIIINHDGKQEVISGLITENNIGDIAMTEVVSDSTLYGDGNYKSPLRISPVYETGMFAPVKRLIDLTDESQSLPSCNSNIKGDRYLIRETTNDFGKLYDFNGVKRIQADLDVQGKGWRIPTKKDWDNMLNAIEPCDEYKNHDTISGNIQCGKLAGKFLKSKKYWKIASNTTTCNTYFGDDSFIPTNNSQCPTVPSKKTITPNGVDAFGFGAVPSGYGDGCQLNGYFTERGMFWTSSVSHVTDIYVKRFDYDKATVIQEIVSPNTIASVRLVKDYDGTNHLDTENILGCDYHTVLIPALNTEKGFQIWTDVNVNFTDCNYCPIEPNNGLKLPVESTYPIYTIAEWDGFKWIKRELKNNDTLIFECGLNGESNVEYRLVDGELVNTNDVVYDSVMGEITPQIEDLQNQICTVNNKVAEVDGKVSDLTNALNDTNEKLNQEIEDRQSADATLNNKISEIYNELVSADTNLKELVQAEARVREEADNRILSNIAQETQDRKSADELIWSSLKQLSGNTETAVTDLKELIKAEEESRIESDEKLNTLITDEVNRAKQAESTLQSNIDNEKSERVSNDRLLNTKIESEVERAKQAEEMLNQLITNETTDRKESDEKLDEYIKQVDAALDLETEERKSEVTRLDGRIDDLETKVDNINSEISDKYDTEIADLDARLQDEIERAMAAERGISGIVTTEISERKSADEEISKKHSEDVTNLTKKIDDEILRATEVEESIKGRLINESGSTFDCANGILTLATDDAKNTITIKLDSNYGTF